MLSSKIKRKSSYGILHKWVLIIVGVLAVVLGGGLGVWKAVQPSLRDTSEATFFEIQGVSVGAEEYLQSALAVKHRVQAECVSKYGARLEDEDFWERSYQGHIPARIAAGLALEKVKNWHSAFALFKEANLIKDDSFSGLQRRLEITNRENKRKIDSGQPVYGLQSYDLSTFISYQFSSLTQQYISNPKNPGMEISEGELRSYYASRNWVDEQGKQAEFEQVRPQAIKAFREEKLSRMIADGAKKMTVQGFSIEQAATLIQKEFK